MKNALTGLGVLVLITGAVAAQTPYEKADDTWITISGTVQDVSRDSFTLDFKNGGTIKVEMDDGDRDADGYKLISGDDVVVSGMIDDDLFEKKKIEASSVFVKKLNTTFFASSVDEEDYSTIYYSPYLLRPSMTVVTGTVTGVDDDEFTVDTGTRKIEVETDEMDDSPFDNGYRKVARGDRVTVTGDMDSEFFDGRVLNAETVTVLRAGSDNETSLR
jgi:uncharacterized protein YdeI (BOF family)